jgi:hypothetical protein
MAMTGLCLWEEGLPGALSPSLSATAALATDLVVSILISLNTPAPACVVNKNTQANHSHEHWLLLKPPITILCALRLTGTLRTNLLGHTLDVLVLVLAVGQQHHARLHAAPAQAPLRLVPHSTAGGTGASQRASVHQTLARVCGYAANGLSDCWHSHRFELGLRAERGEVTRHLHAANHSHS